MEINNYKEILDRAVRIAHEGRNYISEEDYSRLFAPLNMTPEQDKLTRDYFNELHIRFGRWEPGEEEEGTPLSPEDGNYLSFYLEELESLPVLSDDEKKQAFEAVISDADAAARVRLINHYLRDVVDIAKLYVYHGMRLEDLIGEGNIGLMMAVDLLGTVESVEEAEGLIGKTIMDSMDAALKADSELKNELDIILDRINKISEAAGELSEDLRRDVTVSELSENSRFTVEEIEEAILLTGNNIKGLSKNEQI